MFILILTLIATLMHAYLFWRASSVPWLHAWLAPHALGAFAVVLWLLMLMGLFYGHGARGTLAITLEWWAMNWFGVLFIGTVMMLAADLLTGFGFWLSSWAPQMRGLALLTAAVLVVVALIQGHRAPVVVREAVTLPGLPPQLDGTTVAVLSDLHLGEQNGIHWLGARVEQVKKLRPDLILLLGDIFEGHGAPRRELLSQLKRLHAPLGVYAVTGNHDHFGDSAAVDGLLTEAGIHWLHDRWVQLRPGLVLAGVDDLTIRRGRPGFASFVDKALAGRPAGATILLSHTPWQYQQAAAAGVGLMLSGHTHGGQIWPFGYIEKLFYPLLVGRHQVDHMTLIISRGTGLWGPRMRLWRPGEILLLTLRSG